MGDARNLLQEIPSRISHEEDFFSLYREVDFEARL